MWNDKLINTAHQFAMLPGCFSTLSSLSRWRMPPCEAIRAHQGQIRRDSGDPYVKHCERVALDVERNFHLYTGEYDCTTLIIAALLHDTLEDTSVTATEILDLFGYDITSLVAELTSDKEEIKRIGKTAYLANKINNLSYGALFIKLHDRLDNLCDYYNYLISLRQPTLERIKRPIEYAQQTITIIADLDHTYPVISSIIDVCNKINAFPQQI